MKQLARQLLPALALLAVAASAVTADGLRAQTPNPAPAMTNPSFESGTFTGFVALDQLSSDGGPPPPPPIDEVVGALDTEGNYEKFGRLTPTDGDFFAVLNTVRGKYRLRQSVLVQESFAITLSDARLLVDLDFLTDEVGTGPASNDTAAVYLTINETGRVIPVAFFNRNQLQPGGAGEPALGAVRDVGGFRLSSGWKTYEVDVDQYAGKSAFLTFSVRKAARLLGAEARNSALAVDNIRLVN